MTREMFGVCFSEKLERLRRLIEEYDLDACVIKRRDNFAWLTTGGVNCVQTTDAEGVCYVIVDRDCVQLIANTMDAERIYQEEFHADARVAYRALKWHEQSTEACVLEILRNRKFCSDTHLGSHAASNDFFSVARGCLTALEIERYQTLGQLAEQAVYEACVRIEPGMTELEALRQLARGCADRGIENAVNLLGADERPLMYKHCVASEKRIERRVLFAAAMQKWGLTAPLSRTVYFGDKLPDELAERHFAASSIAAESILMCRGGVGFYDISMRQKQLFEHFGFADEWHEHFQGGLTSYILNDSSNCLDHNIKVGRLQVCNWFITILGAKVEETTLHGPDHISMVTNTGLFPALSLKRCGRTIAIPEILVRGG